MEVDLLIDGHASPASKGGTFERRDPVTGELATRAAAGSVEDARRAATVRAAFLGGHRSDPERAANRCLERLISWRPRLQSSRR